VSAAELGLDGTESPDELEARPEVLAMLDRLRSGVVQVAAEVARTPEGWRASSASLYRTARSLMRGEIAVSAR
jgi:2-methylaconitate cis-trans-isomerase PrpF